MPPIKPNTNLSRDLLNLCYVQRWIIAPMGRPQSVAEHTFRVMALVRALNARIDSKVDMFHALLCAMDHDVDEAQTGDIPGTFKDLKKDWNPPETFHDWEILVKVADAIEAWDWWNCWGMKGWTGDKPRPGDDNRDIRKIRWYTQLNPDLLNAVASVMEIELGYDKLVIKATLGV